MSDRALAETRAWVDRAVIGLQLCPFAKAPQVKGQVRYVASEAVDAEALLSDLVEELKLLAAAVASLSVCSAEWLNWLSAPSVSSSAVATVCS